MNKRIRRKQFVATLDFGDVPHGNIRWRLQLRLISRELAHLTPVFKPGEFLDEVTALEFCESMKRYYFDSTGELVRIEKGGTR